MKGVFAMSFDNALAFLKSRKIPTEWLEPVKRGFKCYYCGNGSGDKGTGATLSSDGTRLLCGKCGKAFSYIDIAAFHYNLDISTFSDTVKKICEYEGISLNNHSIQTDETSTLLNHNSQNTKSISIELQNLIVDDVENAKKNLAKLPENEKRGLNDQTLKIFHIGVNFSWTPPSSRLSNEHKKAYSSPRVIIPHLTNPSLPAFHLTYYASLFLSERERLSNASKSPVKGLYGGGRTPFGLNTLKTDSSLIFVSEGEFDALSIWQVTNGKFSCLATGGTSDNGTLNALNSFFPNLKPTIFFAADNDDAGKKFADVFCSNARSFGFPAIPFYFDNFDSPKTDANKILIEQGNTKLAEIINQKIDEAQSELAKIEREQNSTLFGDLSCDYFSYTFLDYLEKRKQFADRKTGFDNLDSIMNGFLPGIYIVGGLAALGKTSFCWQLLVQLARNGEHCIFVSYEMSKGELFSKSVASEIFKIERNLQHPLTFANIGRSKFFEHRNAFDNIVSTLAQEKINLRVLELDSPDIDNLIERLEMFCSKFKRPPVVVIDYLQILVGSTDNTKSAIDNILLKLKNFQRNTNTTFIVISSLNRANYNTEISFQAFKESGGVEYSADVIWGLQLLLGKDDKGKDLPRTFDHIEAAKKQIPRLIQLLCLKNRFGSNFDVGFLYYPNVDFFEPMSDDEYFSRTGHYSDSRLNSTGQLIKSKGDNKNDNI